MIQDLIRGLWAFFNAHSFPLSVLTLAVVALAIFLYVCWLERLMGARVAA